MSELRDLLRDAHQRAARDNANLSSQLVIAMAQAGAPFEKAVASALLSLGTLHAPVTEARRLLRRAVEYPGVVEDALVKGKVVPGFGNSFFKDAIDPAFSEVDEALPEHWSKLLAEAMEDVRLLRKRQRHRIEKPIYPNAAAYTAVVCEIEGVAEGTELALVIEARLPVWASLWTEHRPRKELWRG